MHKLIKTIFKLLIKKERKSALIVIIISLFSSLLDVIGVAIILPLTSIVANPNLTKTQPVLKWLFQLFSFSDTRMFLLFISAAGLILLLFSIGFRILTSYLQTRFVYMCEFSISQRLFELYLKQPYVFFLNRHSSEISKIILNDVSQVTQGVMIPLLQIFTSIVLTIITLILLIIVQPYVTLIIITIVFFSYTLSYIFSQRNLSKLGEARFLSNTSRYRTVSESLGAIKDLKAIGQEQTFINQHEKYALTFSTKYIESQKFILIPRLVLESCVFGGSIVVLIYFLISSKNLSEIIPSIAIFGFAGYRLLPSLQAIFSGLGSLKALTPSLFILENEFTNLKFSSYETSEVRGLLTFERSIKMENISFFYPNTNQAAISNLTIDIQSGTTIAIVGSSGSGKTTTVDLILGLLTPQSGKILIDDECLNINNLTSWQKMISYVSQHVVLLDDSIASNIALGVPPNKIDYNKVEESARKALLHDFIISDLSDGYDTKVGERGVRLSGGQKQRLGIARALYRDPKLIVFDESTSALDSVTENEVMKSLSNLHGQLTIILIAHRISTIKYADFIYVIQKGEVIEKGNYKELMNSSIVFKHLNTH
jgi:ABC-type multidrug transport system fused ATPase/permease subunit